MKKFEITYFYGPQPHLIDKPEIIADIAASGMTLIPIHHDTETNKKALPLLERYGLRAIVTDPRMKEVYKNDNIAGAYEMAKEVAADYAEFPSVVGWDLCDEPKENKFPVLAAMTNAFRRVAPDKETYVNLYPNYATPIQLGSKDYMSHLEAFVNVVNPDCISYDHYHFMNYEVDDACVTDDMSERERLIRLNAIAPREAGGGFFENMADIRKVANKYNLDAMLIVLLVEHGPYRNLTRAELFWEVNMCLAYGFRRISYFTYGTPGDPAKPDPFWKNANGMVDFYGEKLPHYYDVQVINKKLYDIGCWLFDKNSTEIFHIGKPEAGAKEFAPYGGISAIDGENGVIGFFDDGSVYLVNRDFQFENTFTIHTDRHVAIRKDGVFVDFDATQPITIGAGEAVLLKIS